jgi:hypothetical protein
MSDSIRAAIAKREAAKAPKPPPKKSKTTKPKLTP